MATLKYNLIPKPNFYKTLDGTYTVSSGTQVLCAEEFLTAGNYLTAYLKTCPVSTEGAIKLKKVGGMEPESYKLKVSPEGIFVEASDARGAFYGAVTLKTILMQSTKKEGKAIVNGLLIQDAPRYSYRGVQMDESRHFFGVKTVKQVLDMMAMLKLNTFHWHLSDDQGYRIESKVFPLLNSVGSTRKYAGLQGFGFKHRGGEYSHYYKQEEIREIVAYAKKLHITVIPEIDVPGHTIAMLAAYPELSCTGEKIEPACDNGVFESILCAGNEEVYTFLEKLFQELCSLFDGPYFHIGGDEAIKGHKLWEKCPKCTSVMQAQGLKSPKELQGYFMTRVNAMLKKYGKTCIAWNDCINDNFDSSIICQYWFPNNLAAVRKQASHRDFILSPENYFYFDEKYARVSLKKVYKFNEVKVGFAGVGQHIRGIECEHWSEWIDTDSALQFAMFPRLFAVAEVGWTRLENRRYRDFYKRLAWYKTYLNKIGINYSRVEKGRAATRQVIPYHFGADGKEYKKSEELKAKESF